MGKRRNFLIYIILLVYLFIVESKNVFINRKSKQKYYFIKHSIIGCKHNESVENIKHIKCFKNKNLQTLFLAKRKKLTENKFLLFSEKNNYWDILINLNNLNTLRQLKNIKEKCNEKKGKITDIYFLNLLEKEGINVKKIKIIKKNRKQYSYIKNEIKNFLKEHNLENNEKLSNYINEGKDGVKTITNNKNNFDTSKNLLNDNDVELVNMNDANHNNDSILCMHSAQDIQKGETIIDVPNKYIIIFDKILYEMKLYINEFQKGHNVDYIKYILNHKKETEIKKIDSLTLLKYNIFEKHKKFINFINSPNVFLKFWDIKLLILISYIYFISKYVNLLLYYFNFNNLVFVSFKDWKKLRKNKILQKEKHDDNTFQLRKRKKETDIQKDNTYSIKKLENEITKNTQEQMKNEEHFFFYKNYELYINYIVYKNKLTHLPLNYPDSSFNLFMNTNIKNIVYFRKKIIHDIIDLYKNDLQYDFFKIDKDLIRRILFDNNKYYHSFSETQQKHSLSLTLTKTFSESTSEERLAQLEKLYVFTLQHQTKKITEKEKGDNENNEENNDEKNEEGNKKETGDRKDIEFENEQLEKTFTEYITSSLLYNGCDLKSLEELFSFNFLLHIYGYISSHAIYVERSINKVDRNTFKKGTEGNTETGNEAKNKKQNNENKSYVTIEHILNSNIDIIQKEEKKEEIDDPNLLTEYNFNEFEKREKENEKNKYMCLIPFIDICNHNSFCHNTVIQKVPNTENKNIQNEKEIRIDTETCRNRENEEKKKKKKNEVIEVISVCKKSQEYNTRSDLCVLDISMKLNSIKDIKKGEEITIKYATMNNDTFLLEYGFVNNEYTKIYFYFDVNMIREIIIQILSCDKLPLIMLESLPKIKIKFFQQLGLISANENVYERFNNGAKQERPQKIRKEKETLKEYIRKNNYIHEYNIFTIKENINTFLIKEKISYEKKNKKYLYIGGEAIVDPILLAALRIIIFDNLNYLSKIKIDDILKWDNYLSVESEIAVIQVLIKLCDEIIYHDFFDINYLQLLKQGNIKYSQLKFSQNKFFHSNLFNSEEKYINVFEHNNFHIVIYNIIKLKSIQKSKRLLKDRSEQLKKLLYK